MKRFIAISALLGAVQAAMMVVSCGKAEPPSGGTGGAAAWECFTTCMGVTSLVGFDSCEELDAAYCGGAGGGPNGACEGTLGLGGACGTCEGSLEDYCSGHDCAMPDLSDACFWSPRQLTRRGCGFLWIERPVGWTDEPASWSSVWNDETGELLFHAERTVTTDVCEPTLIVGEFPDCADWSLECDSGYACARPPHIECHGCAPGCLSTDLFASCGEMEAAAGCGATGGGGQGGFGGGGP